MLLSCATLPVSRLVFASARERDSELMNICKIFERRRFFPLLISAESLISLQILSLFRYNDVKRVQ